MGSSRQGPINQLETFAAGIIFARTEGFIPAPETNHAIACAIEEAKKAKEEGKEKVILMNLSGHGIIDLPSYDAYMSGKLQDYALPDEEIQKLGFSDLEAKVLRVKGSVEHEDRALAMKTGIAASRGQRSG